jgi:hypothetical protein
MLIRFKALSAIAILVIAGCSHPFQPYNPPPIRANFNVLPVDFNAGLERGRQLISVWSGNRIYSSRPIRYYDLDASFNLVKDSVIFSGDATRDRLMADMFGLRARADGMKLLCVKSHYPDVSLGSLVETDVVSWTQEELLDSSQQISSAAYLSNDSIVYYSYGDYSFSNRTPANAGYYLFIKSQRTKTLLFHYISSLGPGETLNGFDVFGTTLMIPNVDANRTPFLMRYDLQNHRLDTIPIKFDGGYYRSCLFVRYNHDGSRLLYSWYPIRPILGPVNDTSEVGIIDLQSLKRTVLNTNPYPDANAVVALFPDWSPDEKSIVFGLATIATEPAGTVSVHRATILKSIE